MKTKTLFFIFVGSIFVFATAFDQGSQDRQHEGHLGRLQNEDHKRPHNGSQNKPNDRPHGNNLQNQPWTGQHWNHNPWNGFYFPTIPNNVNRNWNLPNGFNRHQHGTFNPWGPQYNGSIRPNYNYADRYAYDFFERNGFTVKSSLSFCNNSHINYIVRSSKSLTSFCTSINRSYGREAIPTFPRA